MGHRFTIITSKYSYLTGSEKSAVPNESGIDVRFARTLLGWHRSYLHRMLAFLSFMITAVVEGLRVEEPDFVIGTSPPMFQAVSAWLIATVRRCPFILEIRDLWPDFAVDLGVLRNRVLSSYFSRASWSYFSTREQARSSSTHRHIESIC